MLSQVSPLFVQPSDDTCFRVHCSVTGVGVFLFVLVPVAHSTTFRNELQEEFRFLTKQILFAAKPKEQPISGTTAGRTSFYFSGEGSP